MKSVQRARQAALILQQAPLTDSMGCVKSRVLSVVPSPPPLARGPSHKNLKARTWRGLGILSLWRRRGKRFTREQRQLIKKYLPSIQVFEYSTPTHREIAAKHWGEVYREGGVSMNSRRSNGSWGRESKQTNVLTELYDTFYAFLEQNAPDLMPVFRASMHVRSKVLVHISAGMRSILASPDLIAKVTKLSDTHLQVGVKLEHFDPLARALFYAMEKTSGPLWTPEVAEAWRRLFVHCSALLMVEQKKLARQPTAGRLSKANSSSVPQRSMMSIREHSSSVLKSSVGRLGKPAN